MRTISSKLILIIIISILIIAVLLLWIEGFIFKKEVFPKEETMLEIPVLIQEEFNKWNLFIESSMETLPEFIMDFYNKDQNSFKMQDDSQVNLEATYYAIEAIHNLRALDKIKNPEEIFEKIRSYYVSPGYYLEKNEDSVFSTYQALRIDRWYQEDLNQVINLNWLKNQSIENENLESEKFDPEVQATVIEIYRHLEIPEKAKKLEEISYPYFDYYCNFSSSNNISDSDFLRTKYYQISLIFSLSGIENITNSCLKEEDVNKDKERLNKINYEELENIKEVYWLFYLKKAYGLEPLDQAQFYFYINNVFKKVHDFYSDKGFKEKLSDSEPNLIGTYYATFIY